MKHTGAPQCVLRGRLDSILPLACPHRMQLDRPQLESLDMIIVGQQVLNVINLKTVYMYIQNVHMHVHNIHRYIHIYIYIYRYR
jgi:hypothetical protein